MLFGLDPTIVNVRRSRLTYGVSVLNRFVSDYHTPEKKIVKDNIEWCADIFDKFVLVDQSIGLGDTVIRKYTPARQNQAQCIISFYCSESDKAIYVTETGVRKIGKDRFIEFQEGSLVCLCVRYTGVGHVQRRIFVCQWQRSTTRDSDADGLW